MSDADWRALIVPAAVVAIVAIWRIFKKKAETKPRLESAMAHTKEAYIAAMILLGLSLLLLGV
jgi:hypothetical protein